MTADRDTTRVVRSWLRTEEHESADRILETVLSRLDATPQRRSWWPSRRIAFMNRYLPAAAAAAAVLIVAVVGYNLLPRSNTVGPPGSSPTPVTPSATPAPIAVGNFQSHGGQIHLEANGDGPNVTGTMIYADPASSSDRFVVSLECTRTTAGGLVMIGGTITETTFESEPKGSRVAIVLQRGSPVQAVIHSEYPDPAYASCKAFLESIPDVGDAAFMSVMEPIEGTVALRP